MKKQITLLSLTFFFLAGKTNAQAFAPIATTGYNLDAIAENTTALSTTGGAIDGSNYVMYSAAYGALYSMTSGLPNSGMIASGTRTYQLQPYAANNMLFVPTSMSDTILLTSPAPYAGISLLCFSTEGAGTMNVTLRFTDNSTQVYTSQSLMDWFSTSGSPIISGFDRANRSTGTPANVGSAGNPRMFNLDFSLTCANRLKNLAKVIIQNTGINPRNCIMAVSGAGMPTYTAAGLPVTCVGGTNGGAIVGAIGGIGPYTFSFATTPPQTGTSAGNLSVGIYSYTAMDAASCAVTSTIAVTQSLVAQPPISISTNYSAVCAGFPVTMACSGAASYTWAINGSTASLISFTPNVTTTYNVSGITSANCQVAGSITITVNPLPVINFSIPNSICINATGIILSGSPTGGMYSGPGGVSSGTFNPLTAGVGTKTISYSYTNSNNCTSVSVSTIVVNALPVLNFTASAVPLCLNSATLTLNATPGGGAFSGTGVTGPVFSPAIAGVGTSTVSYVYTDVNNCTASIISSLVVNALPSVSITTTKKFFCVNSPTLFLNAVPSGGSYSGAGISNSSFVPSVAGAGNYTISYSYTDGNNCTGTAALSVTVSTCTGINQYANENSGLSVYPNPANGSFTLKSTGNLVLSIINELGQLEKMITLDESNSHQLLVENLASGVYFITGQNNMQVIKQKLIITK